MFDILLFIILGIFAGVLSGLLGIGGGVIIVPALMFVFGFSQHSAQGTTLGLLSFPIGLLAAWTYHKQGFVDFKVAGFILAGFLIGSIVGAKTATNVPAGVLSKVFGAGMLVIALKMILIK